MELLYQQSIVINNIPQSLRGVYNFTSPLAGEVADEPCEEAGEGYLSVFRHCEDPELVEGDEAIQGPQMRSRPWPWIASLPATPTAMPWRVARNDKLLPDSP